MSPDKDRIHRECEQAKQRAAQQERIRKILETAEPATEHEYAKRKAVEIGGRKIRTYRGDLVLADMPCNGALLAPMYALPAPDAKPEVVALQFIAPNGDKRFMGPVGNCFFPIGKPEPNGRALVCEGLATGLSLHAATGIPVVLAFTAGNLASVGTLMRQRYGEGLDLIFCADDDWKTKRPNGEPWNPGVASATEAARATRGRVARPTFPDARPDKATDFNDSHALMGLEGGRNAVEAAQPPPPPEAQPATENRPSAILAREKPAEPWPEPLAEEAFHGLAGDIVRTIEPHTESDPAAILLQTLVLFGALVGRGPHVPVESDQHHANLFALCVGQSSKARKGTSFSRAWALFERIPNRPRRVDGLSSGEGLKYAVRDPLDKAERDKAGTVTVTEVDAGVADKRLLVTESEFAQVLRQCSRAGNTLSATIRNAWDRGDLQTLTKNDPVTATGAHICISGHITADEIRAELTATDSANGFANRFLFMAVERSKRLPFGGESLSPDVVHDLSERIEHAAEIARQRGAMRFTEAAREVWAQTYAVLSEGHPGLFGAVTARAEAQTLRLALVYALMDEAGAIDLQHLHAALAVWERCEASARYVFGSALGDRIADAILQAIRAAADKRMTRTRISGLFSKNETAERIGAALALLETRGLIRRQKSEGQGRPAEIWEAVCATK